MGDTLTAFERWDSAREHGRKDAAVEAIRNDAAKLREQAKPSDKDAIRRAVELETTATRLQYATRKEFRAWWRSVAKKMENPQRRAVRRAFVGIH